MTDAAEEELLLAGVDPSAVGSEDIDEEKLLNEPSSNGNGNVKVELDLFDAAIQPSGADDSTTAEKSAKTEPSTPILTHSDVPSSAATATASQSGKKFCCYIGNMTWWTTDEDLQKTIASSGCTDLVDLKFFENRTNGQSKGFCLAVFNTDQSVRIITEKLPLRPVHGQTLVVLPYSKISLARLEEASAKTQTRADPKKMKTEDNGMLNMGTIRIGANGITPMSGPPMMQSQPPMMGGPMMMGGPTMGGPPVMGGPMVGGGPMGRGAPMPNMMMNQMRPMGGPPLGGPQMGGPAMGGPPPMSIVPRTVIGMPQQQMQPAMNPMQMVQPNMGRPSGPMGQQFPVGAHVNPHFQGFQQPHDGAPLSEAEVEEIMTRNRTISSSAVSRAISDATSGDNKSAIETLLTAISLIKQSRVANDDRCKQIISGLHDTLAGIEAKMKDRKRRDRSRSRSRERRHKKRSRSRSRSRSPRRKY